MVISRKVFLPGLLFCVAGGEVVCRRMNSPEYPIGRDETVASVVAE